MATDALLREGQHVMTVCNACRYCEAYCPVFPAMEDRLVFTGGDLTYLANLCHNCGECLYACQYAPPHEFAINVPRTLAKIRVASYEEYTWPAPLGALLRRRRVSTSVALAVMFAALLFVVPSLAGPSRPGPPSGGDFYAVIPHDAMVALFTGVSLWVLAALGVGLGRFWRDTGEAAGALVHPDALMPALGDVFTLRHLHTDGVDCTGAEERRRPWRRWFHHATFYGFLLCFASTTVAAVYHVFLGWAAPYDYGSVPVVLGTVGGLGLLIGPAGLYVTRRARDPELADPDQRGLDVAFIVLLLLTSVTGLLLLALRESGWMSLLLEVHLGCVLALFVTLPYGKFVHAVYRTAALIKYALERSRSTRGAGGSLAG